MSMRKHYWQNCYHFVICDIGIMSRSCLDIVSVKSVQRAIDTLARKMDNSVTLNNDDVTQ